MPRMNRLTCSNVTTAKQTTSSQIGTKLRVSIEDKRLGGAKHPQIFDGIVPKSILQNVFYTFSKFHLNKKISQAKLFDDSFVLLGTKVDSP